MDAVVIDHLVKHFGKTKAVDDITFTVREGEVFGFLGPNGAGKTTAIRCMMDFLRPTAGKVTILGCDSHRESVELKGRLGYVPGNVRLYGHWTGEAHIRFLRTLNGRNDRAEEYVKRLRLDPKIKAKSLSTGNRQKLGLILALMHDPRVLILDEPTVGLDPLLQNVVYEILQEQHDRGVTILMSSHNLAEVERVCERVGIIRDGKMIAVDTIEHLQKKRLYHIRASFAVAPAFLERIPSETVTLVSSYDHRYRFSVTGEPNTFLKLLLSHDPEDLEVTRASLEDIFMAYYT